MLRFFVITCILLTSFLYVQGQEGQPLPELSKLDYATPKDIEPLQRIGMGKPQQLLWSKDGDVLFVATSVGIWLYETNNFNTPPRFFDLQGQLFSDVALSPDGQLLLTGGSKDVRLWDWQTGVLLEKFEVSSGLWDIEFSQSGDMFAVTKGWGTPMDEAGIFLYSTNSGRLIKRIQTQYIFPHIKFFADDQYLFARRMGDCCGDLRVVDISTDEISIVQSFFTHDNSILSRNEDIAYVLENELIAYHLDDLNIEKSASSATEIGKVIVSTQLENGQLVFVEADGKVSFVDNESLEIQHTYQLTLNIDFAEFSPDSRILATMNDNGDLQLINVESSDVIEETHLPVIQEPIMAISPDETLLATILENNAIGIWSILQGTWYRVLTGHTQKINGLVFNDRGVLYSTSTDGTIRTWNIKDETNRIIVEIPDVSIQSIAFGSTFQNIIEVAICKKPYSTSLQESGIYLYDVETGQPYDNPGMAIEVNSLMGEGTCFDKLFDQSHAVISSGTLATYSWTQKDITLAHIETNHSGILIAPSLWLGENGIVEKWQLSSWNSGIWAKHEVIAVHELPVTAAILLNGEANRVISSACGGVDISVWGGDNICLGADLVITDNLTFSYEYRRTSLIGHNAPIRDIQISPMGKWFATASEDGTIIIWGAPSHNE